mmetsp:Transcript_21057/g.49856  ORF Transcript_21057/g.49856 Transcript_21057/m.49856 type:complete len:215 (-) Transcript_21057:85-729(-)
MAARFFCRSISEKSDLPMGTCTMPCLSVRNSILPALNSATEAAGSADTVPALGDGIRPLGPRTLPSFASFGMAGGVASSTSKSSWPAEIVSISSAMPTMSAPAASAASAAGPSASTATRTVLPVPAGRLTVVRICWSLYLGSRLRLACSSIVSVNFAVEVFLMIEMASTGSYSFSLSTWVSRAAFLLLTFVTAIAGSACRCWCSCTPPAGVLIM